MQNKITIAIAEDHAGIRKSLQQNLTLFPSLVVSFVAKNGKELLEELEKNTVPELILMDLDMPVMNGIEATFQIREKYKESIKIIALTVFDDDEKIFDSIKAGASGYLLKDESPQRIATAIEEAMIGGAPMSSAIAGKILKLLKTKTDTKEADTLPNISDTYAITVREAEVLQLLTKGRSYKQIADELFLSTNTIRKHVENIYRKLHINTKVEAIQLVQKYRLG